jgi:hypothetical protein
MGTAEPALPAQPPPAALARARNGLGVAALVIGVASLVAGISFILFPLALLGGLVGLIIWDRRAHPWQEWGSGELGPGHRRPGL